MLRDFGPVLASLPDWLVDTTSYNFRDEAGGSLDVGGMLIWSSRRAGRVDAVAVRAAFARLFCPG